MDVTLINGSVPISTQILCFAATMAGAIYFVRPLVGCVGLLAVCLYGLFLSAQTANSEAVVFYAIMISGLIIPIFGVIRRKPI